MEKPAKKRDDSDSDNDSDDSDDENENDGGGTQSMWEKYRNLKK